jgi:hypothetical protein
MINKQENHAFISFGINEDSGLILDESNHKKYPLKYYNIVNGEGLEYIDYNRSYYGYLYEGLCHMNFIGRPPVILTNGMYFTSTGDFMFSKSCTFKMILIEVDHTKGEYPDTNFVSFYQCGGPIEGIGRLKYIDGCTDSLLIPPVKLGDPCLNHLHFPKNIDQTQHTHPSHRIGIVATGKGKCITPFGDLPLEKGVIFVIKEWDGTSFAKGLDGKDYPCGQHAFETRDSSMNVIAFHPDSDFGATDINHPMINRTIVGNISANQIKDIQTT